MAHYPTSRLFNAESAGTVSVKFGKSSCQITLRKKAPDRAVTTIATTSREINSAMQRFAESLVSRLQQQGVTITGSKGGTEKDMSLVCGRFGVLIQADGEILYDLGTLSSRDPVLSAQVATVAKQLGMSIKRDK